MTNESQPQEEPLLPELEAEPAAENGRAMVAEQASLNSVYDVPVTVSAVLGKTRIDVASLMRLGDGAVIELDRKVGEPIDLYVNDRLIARGELVMVDGSLGVTMTEIIAHGDL
ncbi:MAG: flagellar motor switch protein FliN [Pseudomonadota bacterium]